MKKYFLFFTILLSTNIVIPSQKGGAAVPPSQSRVGTPVEALLGGQSTHNFGRLNERAPGSTSAASTDDDELYQAETPINHTPSAEGQAFLDTLYETLRSCWAPSTNQAAAATGSTDDDGCGWEAPSREALEAMLGKMANQPAAATWIEQLRQLHLVDKARAAISSTGSLDTILEQNKNGTIGRFFDELQAQGECPSGWLRSAFHEAIILGNPHKIAQIIDIINIQGTRTLPLMGLMPPAYQRDASKELVDDMIRSIKERLPRLQVTIDAEEAAHSADPTMKTQRQLLKAMASVYRPNPSEVDSEDDEVNYTEVVVQLQHVAQQKDVFKRERHARRRIFDTFVQSSPGQLLLKKDRE